MESLWQEKSKLPSFEQLNGDTDTDVLIIGGGLAGILTAYFLHQNSVRYILVEKDRICGGTTGNTTAKITVQHGLIYQKIIKNSSVENAQKYLKANEIAFNEYARLCKNIDCDYEVKNNFVYSVNDRQKLENEFDALQKIKCNVQFREQIPLPFKVSGAVEYPNQAQFHPLKFVAAIAKDLNIFENTFVREMIGTTAVTNCGRISAQKVIVATHFPFINKHGSYPLKLYQHRSYVIALDNAQQIDGMYVDEDNKGMSFRNSGNLLLVGGGGHRTGKIGGNWTELRSFAKKYYPHSNEKFFWAAQDCMSLDSIPYIGRYSKTTDDLYVISGFNKWGITGAMNAAIIISNMLLGKTVDYADIFDPSRCMIKPQLLVNGFEAVKNLLTFSEKRCPHLGCALKWNSAEHSWDCPCHGSRFSSDGTVLNNPANGNIK